jgi:uncharacterized protein YjeT (DUF2065 family)
LKELLLPALALMLVLEGIVPLVAPRQWREMFRTLVELRDGQIRFAGLASMTAGLILLFVAW